MRKAVPLLPLLVAIAIAIGAHHAFARRTVDGCLARDLDACRAACDDHVAMGCVKAADLIWLATKDESAAQPWREKACDAGEASYCVLAGEYLMTRRDAPDSLSKAFQRFTKACQAKSSLGCRRLAQSLDCGRGTPRDHDRSTQMFRAACIEGDESSCSLLESRLFESRALADPALPSGTIYRLAARHLRAGHFVDARAWSASLPATMREEHVFLTAIDALEDGRTVVAENLTFDGKDPAFRLVATLASARPSLRAFASAWVRSGRQDMRASRFLPKDREIEPDPFECSAREPSTGATSLATALLAIERPGRADEVAGAPPLRDARGYESLVANRDADLAEVQLASWRWAAELGTVAGRAEEAAKLEDRMAGKLAGNADSLFLQLAPTFTALRRNQPLDLANVARLVERTHAMSAPFSACRQRFEFELRSSELSLEETRALARGLALEACLAPSDLLRLKKALLEKAGEPANAAAAVNALARIGQLLAEEPMLFSRGFSVSWLRTATRLRPDPEVAALADRVGAQMKRLLETGERMAIARWPLPSVAREWDERLAEDEVAAMSMLERDDW